MEIIRRFTNFCNYFFFFYMAIYATYSLICGICGSLRMYEYRKKEELHNELEHDFYYPMSIIVPAYNEGTCIIQTVQNLLNLDYKMFEILVVDDGSKDNTKELVIERFNMQREFNRPIRYSVPCKKINEIYVAEENNIRIVLICKENGGCKADATNAGINVSSYPYFVNMDADEILQRDCLKIAGRQILEDDNVVCVGGNIKISNSVTFEKGMPVKTELGKNLIADMQVLEYGRAFVGSRIFQNDNNMNLIVSGGFGVFKKSAVIEVGGYDTKSMGEDMELTVKLHKYFRKNKIPYVMKYAPDSVCWTQGPDNMRDLRKQRERWYCGLIQTLLKYKSMIFNPRYGLIGMFMIPYTIIYELLNPQIVLLGWFVIAWTIFDSTINLPYVLYIYIMYFFFGMLMSLMAYIDKMYMKKDNISFKKVVQAFFTALIDALFFRMFVSVVSFFAIFKLKKLKKKWSSPRRIVVKSND